VKSRMVSFASMSYSGNCATAIDETQRIRKILFGRFWGAYLKWTSRAQAPTLKSGFWRDYYNRRRTKHNGYRQGG